MGKPSRRTSFSVASCCLAVMILQVQAHKAAPAASIRSEKTHRSPVSAHHHGTVQGFSVEVSSTGRVLKAQSETHHKQGGSLLDLGATQASYWEPVWLNSEYHVDVVERLQQGTDSAEAKAVMELVAPEAEGCTCETERWDQYVLCTSAIRNAKQAFSFGINGYDEWGEHLQQNYLMVPQTFDCFNLLKPQRFENDFWAECLGDRQMVDAHGRRFQTLPQLLDGAAKESVLLKLDIEKSEWNVLASLKDADFERIGSLTVEYHFNYKCPNTTDLERAKRVLSRVRKHMAVIDAGAAYYKNTNNKSCMVGGTEFPKILAVSYTSRKSCSERGFGDWLQARFNPISYLPSWVTRPLARFNMIGFNTTSSSSMQAYTGDFGRHLAMGELEAKAEGPGVEGLQSADLLTPEVLDRQETMPWDLQPYVTCKGHTSRSFAESAESDQEDSRSYLAQVLSRFCSLDKHLAELVEFYPDPNFKLTDKLYRDDMTGFLHQAFITYIDLFTPSKLFGAQMDLLLQSVHKFSGRPIVVANFGTRVPTTWTPERFPQMILVHAKRMVNGKSFNLNKLRAMLFTKVEVGIVLDADQFVNHGVDYLFDRTKQEMGTHHPYPMLPVHWMSRDPESKTGGYRGYDFHFESRRAPRRSMRWGHAHPTFTSHSLPFIGKWLAFALEPEAGAPQWFKDQGFVEDEDLLNIALWSENVTKQWCKFDIPAPSDLEHYIKQDTSLTAMYKDSKWFPRGIPLVFLTAHAAKDPNEAEQWLHKLWGGDTWEKKTIFFDGRWFTNGEALRAYAPDLKCIA